MRISDWSSDVCSSDLCRGTYWLKQTLPEKAVPFIKAAYAAYFVDGRDISSPEVVADIAEGLGIDRKAFMAGIESPEIKAKLREVTEDAIQQRGVFGSPFRSEEHTSELQSLMRNSYAVFCLKQKR